MAKSPNDFRDPKVTTTTKASDGGGIGKWIGIAVAALLLLLVLAWLFGLFANDDVDTSVTPIENGATTIEPVESDAPTVSQ